MHVNREDRNELPAIKHGEWSLQQIKDEADKLFELAREANVRSPLPPEPDKTKVEQLCMRLVKKGLALANDPDDQETP